MPELAALHASLLPQSAGFYFGIVAVGFGIGVLGHLSGSNRLVALGVALIVLGAFLLPLAVNLTESTPPQLENSQ